MKEEVSLCPVAVATCSNCSKASAKNNHAKSGGCSCGGIGHSSSLALPALAILVAATNCMDTIPNCLQWPGRLEREVVVQTPDLGKRLKLLRGMLLSPLMAHGLHDDNKSAMNNYDTKK
jgi:hypothetical protein